MRGPESPDIRQRAPRRNVPRDPTEVRWISQIAQMYPAADPRATRATLVARAAGPGVAEGPPRAEDGAARRRQRLGMALQTCVVFGVLREDVVENAQEARVLLEAGGRRREAGGCADGEVGVRRGGVQIGQEVPRRRVGAAEDSLLLGPGFGSGDGRRRPRCREGWVGGWAGDDVR